MYKSVCINNSVLHITICALRAIGINVSRCVDCGYLSVG